MIHWIAENWYVLVAAAAVIFVAVFAVAEFLKLPTSTQIAALKEWLKYAVTLAEKELGSGTGQLKLRMVYDMFVQKFTWLASYISFDTFSGYVDEALEWMRNQLTSNPAVSTLVSGVSTAGEETSAEDSDTAKAEPDPYADWTFTEEGLAKHTVAELLECASSIGVVFSSRATKATIIQGILIQKG